MTTIRIMTYQVQRCRGGDGRVDLARVARVIGDGAADIVALRKTAEEIRRREVDEALARLPALSESDRAVVDKLATRLVNRFLHGPTERLRSFPESTRVEIVQELLRGMGGTPR